MNHKKCVICNKKLNKNNYDCMYCNKHFCSMECVKKK